MDSQGRLFIADRSNNRIQIYSQDGELLDTWYQFSRASGLYIDEMMYCMPLTPSLAQLHPSGATGRAAFVSAVLAQAKFST